MRSEQEMMSQILSFAKRDERIRIVGMEGSRTNPNVPKDRFQDYDIAFLVTDMASFLKEDTWLDYFGKRIIMQQPENMELFPPELGNWFSYLMLFEDGNRIDLILAPIEELDEYLAFDQLLTILLDKDGLVEHTPVPTDEAYHVKRPSLQMFDDCCNEFWWVSTYITKGLCRGELLFAAEHLNAYVRPALLRMMEWQVGIDTDFSLSVGKCQKYLDRYIPAQAFAKLLLTYENHSALHICRAMLRCFRLFEQYSASVAKALHFALPGYGKNVTAYTTELIREFDLLSEKKKETL